jgi:N-acetyl-gamma-glutamyl-phosphate reductase common form
MSIAAAVLGSSGYVGGELLRLLHTHPRFEMVAAISGNNGGKAIIDTFPHLAGAYADTKFTQPDGWMDNIERGGDLALFSAAPHGASASVVARCLDAAAARDINTHVVDSSADFRYADPRTFESVYDLVHPEAELLSQFTCAVPEHASGEPARHAGHPGCFATAALLAAVPLVDAGLVEGDLFISAITGSTGSGRAPQAGTHHPERHSNLYAYKPLAHRHVPEISNLITQATGKNAGVSFVPHSGPFSRGIYATLQAKTQDGLNSSDLQNVYSQYYAAASFVRVVDGTPRLKHVIASNYANIGVATNGQNAVVMCAIDNLVKGAAGGAIQWMNRLWSLPETSGLLGLPPAWT